MLREITLPKGCYSLTRLLSHRLRSVGRKCDLHLWICTVREIWRLSFYAFRLKLLPFKTILIKINPDLKETNKQQQRQQRRNIACSFEKHF